MFLQGTCEKGKKRAKTTEKERKEQHIFTHISCIMR